MLPAPSLGEALAAASSPPRPAAAAGGLPRLLVVGAGGVLGAAVLAEGLASRSFARVQALVTGPVASTLRGFEPVIEGSPSAPAFAATAIVVLERERRANGRDDAFVRPRAEALVPLASWLRAAGVARLVVVVPHTAALLPEALKHGFANEDERALSDLGFEHLVFIRAADHRREAATPGARLHRFAAWWLGQFAWMVPAAQQPLRAEALARACVRVAAEAGALPRGTRVLSPERLRAIVEAPAAAGAPPSSTG
jgi:hypothetical protein